MSLEQSPKDLQSSWVLETCFHLHWTQILIWMEWCTLWQSSIVVKINQKGWKNTTNKQKFKIHINVRERKDTLRMRNQDSRKTEAETTAAFFQGHLTIPCVYQEAGNLDFWAEGHCYETGKSTKSFILVGMKRQNWRLERPRIQWKKRAGENWAWHTRSFHRKTFAKLHSCMKQRLKKNK